MLPEAKPLRPLVSEEEAQRLEAHEGGEGCEHKSVCRLCLTSRVASLCLSTVSGPYSEN